MASIYGIVPDDLKKRIDNQRLIELADSETSPTGTRNDAVIDYEIARAEMEFEEHAGKLHALPVSPVTARLQERLVDMAAYNMMTRKPEQLSTDAASAQGNYWVRLRKEILDWLAKVATDPLAIPGVTASPATASSSTSAEVVSDAPVFSKESMEGFF